MFGNGRKTIGVIICDITIDYSSKVCQAISSYARKKDYNIAFFTYFTSFGTETRNGRGEASIIHLIPYEKLDAVIFCYDTMINDERRVQLILDEMKTRCGCPIVTFRHDTGTYPCVLVDPTHTIEELVYHMIDKHHKTRIAFMSGPAEHPDTITRLQDYKIALKNRGIPYEERLVFEGDFWTDKAKDAVRYYTKELEECPEAIICANDYMATSVIDELVLQGFHIPGDIAVTGYDDIEEASLSVTPVTTVFVPVEEMVQQGMRIIEHMWEGIDVPRINYVRAQIRIRNSCGCHKISETDLYVQRILKSQADARSAILMKNNNYMFVHLSDLDTLDNIENQVRILKCPQLFIRNFFICLGKLEGNDYLKFRSAEPGFPPQTKAVGAVLNHTIISTEVFQTSDLLPAEASEDKPMIYYFYPLHKNEFTFGYFATAYEKDNACDHSFLQWLSILGNTLEMIRIKQKNQGLLNELKELYVQDALTGLLNRRGFDRTSQEFYSEAKKEQQNFFIIAIDMDNLKIINDQFGHKNGDIALKTVATAMKEVAREQDACARVGGDEYNITGIGLTEEQVSDTIQSFQNCLRNFNETSNLPYLVHASVGYYLWEPGDTKDLESCVIAADAHLYEHKRQRKERGECQALRTTPS
nr:diguanylate cyclase [Eubacterium sp.]